MTDLHALCKELVDIVRAHCNPDDFAVSDCAAVLTRASAALAQPEPEGPTDEELEALAQELDDLPVQAVFAFARAVLACWGHPTPQPIPVAERLPEAGDCDAEGRCWFWGEQLSDSDDEDWGWKLLDRTYGINWSGGPWLPAHALPLPQEPPQ